MKLINGKDIGKILDENTDPIDIENFDEPEQFNPCWEVKIDKNRNKILFLIDGEEKLSTPLAKFKPEEITLDLVIGFLKLFKEKKIDELKKATRTK